MTTSRASHADDSVDAALDADDERALDDDPVGDERPGASEPSRATPAPVAHPGSQLVIAAAALALVNVFVLALAGIGWLALVVHVMTAALAVAGWMRMHADPAPGDAWRLLALSTAALGPVGVVGAGALGADPPHAVRTSVATSKRIGFAFGMASRRYRAR